MNLLLGAAILASIFTFSESLRRPGHHSEDDLLRAAADEAASKVFESLANFAPASVHKPARSAHVARPTAGQHPVSLQSTTLAKHRWLRHNATQAAMWNRSTTRSSAVANVSGNLSSVSMPAVLNNTATQENGQGQADHKEAPSPEWLSRSEANATSGASPTSASNISVPAVIPVATMSGMDTTSTPQDGKEAAWDPFYLQRGKAITTLNTTKRKVVKKFGGPPPINASGGENMCKKVIFLSIQKTGTTTLYSHILPAMTARQQQTTIGGHVNYRMAMEHTYDRPECVFAMLRDPVDRFLSEFAMARGQEGFELFNQVWDFHEDDLEWLWKVEHMPNVTEALLEYLRYKNNPTRNRQTLYMLGFNHVSSCRVWLPNHKVSKCPEKEIPYPAHEYDWDKQHEELLAIAKEHLLNLRAFGITDCYTESLEHIAVAMGWDPVATVQSATEHHARWNEDDKRLIYFPLKAEHGQIVKEGVHTLAHYVTPEIEAEIRRVNSLDVELVSFARQILIQRGFKSCARGSVQ